MYKQLGLSVLLNNNHVSLTSDEPGDRGFSGRNLEMRTFPVSFAAHNGLVAGSSAAGPTSIYALARLWWADSRLKQAQCQQ